MIQAALQSGGSLRIDQEEQTTEKSARVHPREGPDPRLVRGEELRGRKNSCKRQAAQRDGRGGHRAGGLSRKGLPCPRG